MTHSRLLPRFLLIVGLAGVVFAPPALGQTGQPSSGPPPAEPPPDVAGWKVKLYGFVELDAIHDSTQSFFEASLNLPVFPRGTYFGDNGRTQFTAKNSRIGVVVNAPTYGRIGQSANINFDFFGLQPTDALENDFNVVGTMRLRHAYYRLQTPVVDVFAGQLPQLFGWGGAGFYPGTVAFLGTVGELYHHTPQLRLSKTVGGNLSVETAAAASRPAQRDSEIPDIEGGIRLVYNPWLGRTIQGNDVPEVIPLSLGVSGLWRHFAVNEYLEIPRRSIKTTGWGMAVNALVPILPARDGNDYRNCLTLTGEFSTGSGVADRYSALTGGARFPALPNPSGRNIPPIYIPNIDSGLVTFDSAENLRTIDWQAFVVGVQYYLPVPTFRVWVTGLYARVESHNLKELTPAANYGDIFTKAEYMDGSLFVGIAPNLHFGISGQVTKQERGDGAEPRNIRVHFATNLFF